MTEQKDEICPKCGAAKAKSRGSITQWIAGCTCDLQRPPEAPVEEPLDLCQRCFKRIQSGRAGSFTQWIFRQDVCSCGKDAIKRTAEEIAKADKSGDGISLQSKRPMRKGAVRIDDGSITGAGGAGGSDAAKKSSGNALPLIGYSIAALLVISGSVYWIHLKTESLPPPPATVSHVTEIPKSKPLKELYDVRESLTTFDDSSDQVTVESFADLDRQKITSMRFRDCNMTDEAMEEIAKFPKITNLSVAGCKIQPAGFSSIGKVTALRRLIMFKVTVRDQDLKFLKNLQNVRGFSLGQCDIDNNALPYVSALSNVEVLELQATKLDGAICELKNLNRVDLIDLSETRITDEAMTTLTKFHKLKKLYVWKCPLLTAKSLELLSKHPGNISVLWIGGSKILPKDLAPLTKVPLLRELSLEGMRIGDKDVKYILALKQLTSLNVAGSSLSNKGVMELAKLPNLNALAIYDCPLVTQSSLDFIKATGRIKLFGAKPSIEAVLIGT